MYEELVKKIADVGIAKHPPKEGDYWNEEGLLMCGICHTPKQKRIKPIDREMVVMIPCKCEKTAQEKEAAEKKRLEDFDKVMALKGASIVDDKFRGASFDTCAVMKDNAKQIRLCKRYVEKFDDMLEKNQGLLLYGNVGTGKSHLAACMSNLLMEQLVPVYATSFVKLLEENPKNVDVPGIIAKMGRAQLVLFDDLGAERNTSYALEMVYNLIDSRYRQRKPMIVTTNLSLEEMQTVPDIRFRRIYDRVLECCYPVLFDGQSFRLKEAAKRFDEMGKLLGG